ncbi:hypothetical protein [Streptomyces katsurahamanus]|uniref:Uncharacterized protein n=1 Tax=Streptomyces katsurahamanus TaxID=2577098 RepID=A0ABW9NSL5_9ACTN|nr:hypothetical protein [Streptomyces katsurahamanus]MQS36146.1 hypothetical protein [Streptomyces katsurahamanus]
MSQVNIARPHTPGYDELVPSHYALKVGDIDAMRVPRESVTRFIPVDTISPSIPAILEEQT